MKLIEVYTDGSATSEGKPGGYGYVLVVDGCKIDQGSGYVESGSNNDLELEAAIQGLAAALKYSLNEVELTGGAPFPYQQFEIILVSDSRLILGWASGQYRFKQLEKINKYNIFKKLVDCMHVKTRWVRGHSGDQYNELCDKLANAARLKLSNEIDIKEKKANGQTAIGKRKTGIICLYYKNQLKVVDIANGIVENYDRELHGSRGGILEVREEKSR